MANTGIDCQVKGSAHFPPYTGSGCATPPEPPVDNMSHETFIHAVRTICCNMVKPEDQTRLNRAKLVYGAGAGSYRGVTFYQAWSNGEPGAYDFIEIAATGEESNTQLIGTTVHELGHILAGYGHGHDKHWKECCAALGLAHAEAAGQSYMSEHFKPEFWAQAAKLSKPNDGNPTFNQYKGPIVPSTTPRPCPMGIGTRGGKTRGKGSGSRLRLWECPCGVKGRWSSDNVQALCLKCNKPYEYKGK